MRTRRRMKGLQAWIEKELCAGRQMKCPNPEMDLSRFEAKEPQCYIAWAPQRRDAQTGQIIEDYTTICPAITIMPMASKVKFMEEKRFDRYNKISRPKEMGQTLAISMLFSVYEPGIRLPGFADSMDAQSADMRLLRDGTEEGLFTLFDWMDEAREKLLAVSCIPGTDLFPDEESMEYSLYTDSQYVVDRRPVYFGFLNLEFTCHADTANNDEVENYL